MLFTKMDKNVQSITAWVLESNEFDNLYDLYDSADDPDFIQPNEQCDSNFSDTEFVINDSNTSRHNRSNMSNVFIILSTYIT